MRRIEYLYNIPVNTGTKEAPVWEDRLYPKSLIYSAEAEEIAKREAFQGNYEITPDDGEPEPDQFTQLDRVEAQVTYTAMMTDTLLEV